MENEFKISMTRKVSKEVWAVCNLSTGVYNKGYDSGHNSGLLEGRQQGLLEGEIIGVIRADKRNGIPQESTRRYIMEEYKKSEEEIDELMRKYWK